ncbi:MAG: diguanylate cyclase [Acetatifactor sp.]|nr:diguanylate cyclase [Acetatifactor sp.]
MQSENRGKIGQVLQMINIIPLLAFCAITVLLSYQWFSRTMYSEVRRELQYAARNINTLMETAYPGDYRLEGESSFKLYKGDTDITNAFKLVDRIKSDTDLEITLFYQDTRILTTLYNTSGARIVGTGAPDTIIEDVLKGGEDRFYSNVLIYGSNYFSYYMPILNSDGTVTGMLFVGKPTKEVDAAVQQSLYPLILTTICTTIAISLFLFFYTKRLMAALHHIRKFLADVATGNLTAELNPTVSKRNDEFGDIGRSAVAMQRSLRTMVDQDALTELYNRRCADRKLKQVINKYETQDATFCLAIGDIDFFKKVNDTYGHDCGDMVLKNISAKLKSHMYSNGFVARWGGEEFLLVFERTEITEAYKALEALLNDIRAMENTYENHIIQVTMTFGLTAGDTTDIVQLLRQADDRLYYGKTHGRNQIVRGLPSETAV